MFFSTLRQQKSVSEANSKRIYDTADADAYRQASAIANSHANRDENGRSTSFILQTKDSGSKLITSKDDRSRKTR